jgi:hypothetical protein
MGEEGKDTLWKSFRERIQRGNGRSSRPNPSSLIQFKSKVHFLKKGGGYLGEDLHGEEKGLEWPDIQIAGCSVSWREMRRGRE